MQAAPGSFKDSYWQGMKAVIRSNGSYAFIGESTALERMAKGDCRLKTLADSINNQDYGFALPKSEQDCRRGGVKIARLFVLKTALPL